MLETKRCNAPIETRFPNPLHRKDHTQKGPYLLPILKKLLEKEITVDDPKIEKILESLKSKSGKASIKRIILLKYLLNATQGDNQAIEGILDRIDGKAAQKLIGEGFGESRIILVTPKTRKENANRVDALSI